MTLPPQGSPHYELRRRIVGCRERLRRNRTAAHKDGERADDGAGDSAGRAEAVDEEGDENVPRTRKRPRR